MPVRPPDAAVAAPQPTAAETPRVNEGAAPVTDNLRRTVYSNDELMAAKTASLYAALASMSVEVPDDNKKNTHKKARDLFAANQEANLTEHGYLPSLEFESKAEYPQMAGAVDKPQLRDLPTTPDGPAVASQRTSPLAEPDTLLAVQSVSTVTYTAGATVNVGRFESRRIETSITIPTDYTTEDLTKATTALDAAKGVVLAKLNSEVAKLESNRPADWDKK